MYMTAFSVRDERIYRLRRTQLKRASDWYCTKMPLYDNTVTNWYTSRFQVMNKHSSSCGYEAWSVIQLETRNWVFMNIRIYDLNLPVKSSSHDICVALVNGTFSTCSEVIAELFWSKCLRTFCLHSASSVRMTNLQAGLRGNQIGARFCEIAWMSMELIRLVCIPWGGDILASNSLVMANDWFAL